MGGMYQDWEYKQHQGRFQPQSPEHAHAVARVKAIQKMDGGRDQWASFIERQGGGKRDPAARSVGELREFLSEADPEGSTAGVESSFDEEQLLVMKVKHGQRFSEEFKQCWWQHCSEFGNDVRDPTRH